MTMVAMVRNSLFLDIYFGQHASNVISKTYQKIIFSIYSFEQLFSLFPLSDLVWYNNYKQNFYNCFRGQTCYFSENR